VTGERKSQDHFDALIERDWSDAWETLPDAPDLVPRGKSRKKKIKPPEPPSENELLAQMTALFEAAIRGVWADYESVNRQARPE